MIADRCRVDAGRARAHAGARRVRHGLRAVHRADYGNADGHQLPEVRAGGRVRVAVRQRARRHELRDRRHVLSLQEPQTVAARPGHGKLHHRQSVRRAGRVRAVLPHSRLLRHQAAHDEQTAQEDTALLQEVPARIADDCAAAGATLSERRMPTAGARRDNVACRRRDIIVDIARRRCLCTMIHCRFDRYRTTNNNLSLNGST